MDETPRLRGPVDGPQADAHLPNDEPADAGAHASANQPNADSRSAETGEPQSRTRRRRRRQSPQRDDLLEMLARLLVTVGLGLTTPAQATVMRSIVDTILRHMHPQNGAGSAAGPLDMAALRKLVRAQPMLLDALEPILSDEQIAELVLDAEGPANDA